MPNDARGREPNADPAPLALALPSNLGHPAQLTAISATESQHLHGIGPEAFRQLHQVLASQGLSFADG